MWRQSIGVVAEVNIGCSCASSCFQANVEALCYQLALKLVMNKNYRIKCLRRKLSKPFIKNIPSKKRFFVFVKFLILQIEGSSLVFEKPSKLLHKKSPENQEQVKEPEANVIIEKLFLSEYSTSGIWITGSRVCSSASTPTKSRRPKTGKSKKV